jgi:hypothetical protein
MYGSAVTHEYNPGVSDINTVVVLKDNAVQTIEKCLLTVKKWGKRRVSIPFFMTRDFIADALDSYPIEFLDIQTNYRILQGEDPFEHLDIKREHLRLQCERELRGVSIHLRKEFMESNGNPAKLRGLLFASMKRLLPVFKAITALNGKAVPKIRGDVVMAVEDIYNLGASVFSEAAQLNKISKPKDGWTKLFDRYVATIDKIIENIDKKQ